MLIRGIQLGFADPSPKVGARKLRFAWSECLEAPITREKSEKRSQIVLPYTRHLDAEDRGICDTLNQNRLEAVAVAVTNPIRIITNSPARIQPYEL